MWSAVKCNFPPIKTSSGVPMGGLGGSNPPHTEIPKALQNRAELNPIMKTVKYC